MKGSQVQEEDD